MATEFGRPQLVAAMTDIADTMEVCKDEINEADGKLGDGDLGVTMSRGMASIRKILPDLPDDVGMALFACAKCFTRISGSTYGTLLATGLMAVAKRCQDRPTVAYTEVAGLLETALQAMQKRGKANLGDKTVLDSIASLRDALANVADGATMAATAATASQAALDEYRGKLSKQGRARMFGEKSAQLDDPGMLALHKAISSLQK